MDIEKKGRLVIHGRGDPLDQDPKHSCVLDIVDSYGYLEQDEVARVLNESEKDIAEIESKILRKLRGYKIAPKLYELRKLYKD